MTVRYLLKTDWATTPAFPFLFRESTLHTATLTAAMEVVRMRTMKRKHAKAMQVATPDLSQLLRPYSSGWVALSSDETHVVAAADSLKATEEKAREQGEEHPLLVKVLPPERGYISVQQ
jgi:hypothetical protein